MGVVHYIKSLDQKSFKTDRLPWKKFYYFSSLSRIRSFLLASWAWTLNIQSMHLNYKQFSSGFSALEWRYHFATSSAHFQNRHLVEHLEHSFLFIEQFSMLNGISMHITLMLHSNMNHIIWFKSFRVRLIFRLVKLSSGSIVGHTLNLIFGHSLNAFTVNDVIYGP